MNKMKAIFVGFFIRSVVAALDASSNSLKEQVMALNNRADDNVYVAKHNGRGRVVVA